jgi:hypothetical protein
MRKSDESDGFFKLVIISHHLFSSESAVSIKIVLKAVTFVTLEDEYEY